jgi:hypothetical protein
MVQHGTKYRTPAERDMDWEKRKGDKEPADSNTYRALISGLLWLALGTRPDILFAVIALSQHATNPARRHRKALDRICGYLRKAQEMGLYYTSFENAHTEVYTDAAYANDKDIRRSWYGYIGYAWGNAVSWRAARQKIRTLSSTEAEYVSAAEGAKQALWMGGLVEELGGDRKAFLKLDCKPAVFLAENPTIHDRTKHIDVRHHFVREAIINKKLNVQHILRANNPADITTHPVNSKPIEREQWEMPEQGRVL